MVSWFCSCACCVIFSLHDFIFWSETLNLSSPLASTATWDYTWSRDLNGIKRKWAV
jgi:hypothetical protein